MDIQAVNNEGLQQASALRMAFGILNPFLLKCALRLKIPDIIFRAGQDARLSVDQIAAQLPSEAPDLGALSRVLSYLSSMEILQAMKSDEDALGINAPAAPTMTYGLTNIGKTYFVSQDLNPSSLAPLALLQTHNALEAAWDHIHERVLHGGDNFQKSRADGQDFWCYAASDGEFNNVFNAAMVSLTKVDMGEILATYDGFKEVNTLVDLGGGHGEVLSKIVGLYPHINAINFDLPHVIATAPTLPGIKHIAGNVFESVPAGDAIFMKHVLHLWDDEYCSKLLDICYKALSDKGKVIIAEAVLDRSEDSDPVGSGQLMDIVMLNVSSGGRERTQKQWNGLLQSAGFSLSKIVGRKGSLTKIIEAVKC